MTQYGIPTACVCFALRSLEFKKDLFLHTDCAHALRNQGSFRLLFLFPPSYLVLIYTQRPSGVILKHVNSYIPTQSPEEDCDHLRSPGWQPTLHVAWYLIWRFASIGKEYGHTWHQMFCWNQVSINNTKPKLKTYRGFHKKDYTP